MEDSHPAIIPPQVWELTQLEMRRRQDIGKNYSGASVFSARLVCEECGCFYGPRYWDGSNGRKIVWRCAHRYGKKKGCESPIITEEDLKRRFVDAVNEIVDGRDLVLDRCRTLYEDFQDTTALDNEIEEHLRECEIIAELSRKLVEDNTQKEMDQSVFLRKYNSYVKKYDAENKKAEDLKALRVERLQKAEAISAFMFEIHERDQLVVEFSERLWIATIEKVTVCHDGKLIFQFKNGMEVSR